MSTNRKALAASATACDSPAMLNIASLVIGAIALVLVVIAFIPLLGLANWFIVPFAVVGLALGAMSDKTSGRNLNIVVIVIGVIRLMLGGGII
jgi:ABC-type transport system involved in cytochrome bd biosynthesis fused ATPase/permease subunit